MIQLTDRQRLVLDTVRRLTHEKGYPPSVRELGRALGIRSTHGVDDHLHALIRKGYLTRTAKYTSRGIVVVGDTPAEHRGPPRPASESGGPLPRILVYESLHPRVVARDIARPSCAGAATGALVVRGEALAARGIRSGDLLFVDERDTTVVPVGRLVVVRLDEGAVIRSFAMDGGMVKLCAADPSAAPFLLRPDDFRRAVIAVVIGVFRDMGAATEAG